MVECRLREAARSSYISDRSGIGGLSDNLREFFRNRLIPWIGLSALVDSAGPIPGALPQAGMNRACGPLVTVQIVIAHIELRAKARKKQIANSHL